MHQFTLLLLTKNTREKKIVEIVGCLSGIEEENGKKNRIISSV